MLYYLFRILEQYGISGSHLWGYIVQSIVGAHPFTRYLGVVR